MVSCSRLSRLQGFEFSPTKALEHVSSLTFTTGGMDNWKELYVCTVAGTSVPAGLV